MLSGAQSFARYVLVLLALLALLALHAHSNICQLFDPRLPFLTSRSSHHDSPTHCFLQFFKCDVYPGHDPAGTTTCKGRGTNYYGRAYKWEIPEDELPPYVSNPYPNR